MALFGHGVWPWLFHHFPMHALVISLLLFTFSSGLCLLIQAFLMSLSDWLECAVIGQPLSLTFSTPLLGTLKGSGYIVTWEDYFSSISDFRGGRAMHRSFSSFIRNYMHFRKYEVQLPCHYCLCTSTQPCWWYDDWSSVLLSSPITKPRSWI